MVPLDIGFSGAVFLGCWIVWGFGYCSFELLGYGDLGCRASGVLGFKVVEFLEFRDFTLARGVLDFWGVWFYGCWVFGILGF